MNASNVDLKLRGLWLMIGYALVMLVVYLSMTSNPIKLAMDFPQQDKLMHMLAYFSLMFWFSQIYHETFQRRVLVAIFLLQGLLMEYLQSLDSYRTADAMDMVANAVGVLLAYVVTRRALRYILIRFESIFFRT